MRVIIILTTIIAFGECNSEYFAKRAELAEAESAMCLGGNIELDSQETVVNDCLMRHKFDQLDYAFDHPQYFNFSKHFFTYKDKMRQSKVYKILQDMPKGASLHTHDMALLGPDYIMNITYMDHLYFCYGPFTKILFSKLRLPVDNHLYLKFSNQMPNNSDCTGWQLLSNARKKSANVSKFDAELRQHFTLVVDNPDQVYPTITETWVAFLNYFVTLNPLLSYRPVWEQYFYDALKAFRADNIMYMEVRSLLPNLYELDGTTYDQIVTAKAYQKALNRFMKDYSDFEGAKIIYAPSRYINNDELAVYIETARALKVQVPEIFAGFDLVGQEDPGTPLMALAPQLLAASDLQFFFHAGETDWWGTRTDGNLYDAVLLGARRIGHAYALLKHPRLMQEVVDRDIGLEINVLSNAVLSLVRDVRNHPLSAMLARGLPVVLASDDPAAWEASPATDDFYVAFLAVASRLHDLRILKALAANSIKYSALEPQRKAHVLRKFHSQWKRFINNFDCSKY